MRGTHIRLWHAQVVGFMLCGVRALTVFIGIMLPMLPPLQKRALATASKATGSSTKQRAASKRALATARSSYKKQALPAAMSEDRSSKRPLLPPLQKSQQPCGSRSLVGARQTTPPKRRRVSAQSPYEKEALPATRGEEVNFATTLLPALKRSRQSSDSRSLVSEMQGSAKRRKVSAKSPYTNKSFPAQTVRAVLDVGPVSESKEDHLRRHDGGRNDCPRCRFYVFGAGWMRAYGSVQDPRRSHGTLIVWMQERPQRFQGQWAVGCAFCAHAAVSAKTTARVKGRGQGRRTGRAQKSPRLLAKWSRHEVRCAHLQSEHIRKHAFSKGHKLAAAGFFAPEAPLVVLLQKNVEDDELLQGAVPQLVDWLRVWRMCREPQSWVAAENAQYTERYISQLRDGERTSNGKRRALQSMALIAREVTREKKRNRVRSSTHISYAFDERDGHMLLRYRCDVPPCDNDHCRTAWGFAQAADISEKDAMELCHSCGVVGVGRMYFSKTLEEMTSEGASQLVEDVLSLIRAFCTPLGDSLDADLYEAMKRKCISVAVDGAALKAARLLQEKHMLNIIIVCRDASHAIRIACKEPLVRTGGFKKQHEELFKKKGALLKNIDYSNKMKAELEACQKYVVATEGHQGGGLAHIMRNLSHAPQRWESMSAPYRTYCCIARAIGMMLGVIVDWDQE